MYYVLQVLLVISFIHCLNKCKSFQSTICPLSFASIPASHKIVTISLISKTRRFRRLTGKAEYSLHFIRSPSRLTLESHASSQSLSNHSNDITVTKPRTGKTGKGSGWSVVCDRVGEKLET